MEPRQLRRGMAYHVGPDRFRVRHVLHRTIQPARPHRRTETVRHLIPDRCSGNRCNRTLDRFIVSRNCVAFHYRFLPCGSLSGRHENPRVLVHGQTRPRYRIFAGRGYIRISLSAPLPACSIGQLAQSAIDLCCSSSHRRGHKLALGEGRPAYTEYREIRYPVHKKNFREQKTPARLFRVFRPHVGTLRNVDLDFALPVRQLRCFKCGKSCILGVTWCIRSNLSRRDRLLCRRVLRG